MIDQAGKYRVAPVLTTDKIDVEIPSPASGRLERILVEPGDTVDVGTALAELDANARPGEAHPEEHREEPPRAEPRGEGDTDRSGFHSPVVRRMAEEHGIDLSSVQGTGIGGRIRKRDLVALIESGAPSDSPAESTAPTERPLHIESPYRAEPAPTMEANGGGEPAAEVMPGERREPMSPMRRQIAAAHGGEPAHGGPLHDGRRGRLAGWWPHGAISSRRWRGAASLSPTSPSWRARAVGALGRHPVLNASIDGEEIVYHDDVNLGIAVALDRGADRAGDPASAAAQPRGPGGRDRRPRRRAPEPASLQPDDVAGGTFTITNPGQFGAVLATPIINQPQVAILDLEAVVKRPVVIGEDGEESIAIRPMTYLCMSWDHRALDGAEAARFLGDVKARLEGWEER